MPLQHLPEAIRALSASTDVPKAGVTIHGEQDITGYPSSDKARRGFCRICGSSLFWSPTLRDWIGIAAGAFDVPTETCLAMHIFTAEKGDYDDLSDDVAQFKRGPHHA